MYEELTAFLPKLKECSFGEWIIDRENDGSLEQPKHFPFVSYARVAEDFMDAAYYFADHQKEMELNRYGELLEEVNLKWDADSMTNADVSVLNGQTVMALIIGAIRAERFCDGALLDFFENGSIAKWLTRLQEIDNNNNGERASMAGTITIKYCDIEKVETDCIVNAANDGLWHGTGVCDAVFKGAGIPQMTEACNEIGHCDIGKAVITRAFNLPAKWVIHAVGPHTSQPDAMELLRSAYICSMELVREKGCHRVTFPLISSGAFNDANLSYEPLWNAAISAVRDYQTTYPDYPIDVLFACHGHQLIDVGKKVLASPPAAKLLNVEQKERDDDFGIWLAQRAGHLKTHYRIYVAKTGGFRDAANYEFIAEFESQKLASNYVDFMRGKKRYSDKDIIVQEVFVKKMQSGEETNKGKVVGVVTAL